MTWVQIAPQHTACLYARRGYEGCGAEGIRSCIITTASSYKKMYPSSITHMYAHAIAIRTKFSPSQMHIIEPLLSLPTHMCVRRVREPSSDGRVPVNWLDRRSLRAASGRYPNLVHMRVWTRWSGYIQKTGMCITAYQMGISFKRLNLLQGWTIMIQAFMPFKLIRTNSSGHYTYSWV